MLRNLQAVSALLCFGMAASIFSLDCQDHSALCAQETNLPQPTTERSSVTKMITSHLQSGSAAYNAKEYSKSVEQYSKALDLGRDDPIIAFNAACSAALSDQRDLAFDFLESAIGLGYVDSRHLKKDTDLKLLHADARWENVVTRMTAAEKAVKSRWNSPAFKTPFKGNISDSEKAAGFRFTWRRNGPCLHEARFLR